MLSLITAFALPSFMVADALMPGWSLKPAFLAPLALGSAVVRAFLKYPMRNYTWEWFIARASGRQPPKARHSFAPRRAFAGVRLGVSLLALRLGITAAFLLLPAGATALLIARVVSYPMSLPLLITLASAAGMSLIIGLLFAACAMQSYSCADYYFAACPGISVIAALKNSREQMKGKSLEMLLFKASFLPWLLLCILIFPAGYVWTYYKQSLTCCIMAR